MKFRNNSHHLKINLHEKRNHSIDTTKLKAFCTLASFLGHKNIKNTLRYTQLIEFGGEDEYHGKVARTSEEAKELAKAGFQYFTEIEGAQVFTKR